MPGVRIPSLQDYAGQTPFPGVVSAQWPRIGPAVYWGRHGPGLRCRCRTPASVEVVRGLPTAALTRAREAAQREPFRHHAPTIGLACKCLGPKNLYALRASPK